MTNIWSTLLPCNLCHQQDCHLDHVCHGIMFGDDYIIKSPQAPEYIASLDNVSFPPVGHPQGAGPVDVPSGDAIGSRALPMVSPLLNQAPTLAPKNKGSPWGSRYAQVNYPVSTPSTSYSDEVGRGYIDCTADINAYPSITPLSLNFAAGYPSRCSQDDGSTSQFNESPFAHCVASGSTMGLALHDWPDHHGDVSSLSASPNPIMPPAPGPHPSGYLDNENFPMPLGRATNSDRFTGQPYLPPSKSTEVASTPVKPYNLPYAFPAPLQPNPNAQAVNICASASTPQPPNLPPPLPSEIDTYESPSGIGSGNFPTLATPPTADHSHTNFMVNPYGANRVRGCAKARCRKMMEGSPRASQPISARNAGCYYAETQSRTRTRTSAGPPRDQSIETPCGWLQEDGRMCNESVTRRNCATHFAAAHGIKRMAADVEVLCRWCPLSAQKEVTRHNFLRHLREAHLRCPRSKKQDA